MSGAGDAVGALSDDGLVGAYVLVVDDEAAVAKVTGALLEQAGYRVTVETSPEQALQRLSSERVDVVLTDLRMPGMDGLTLLRRVRQLQPDVPVVMLTAHATVTSAIEALRAGAADFMLKPVDRDELVFTIGKAAARRPGCDGGATSPLIGDAPALREVRELITKAGRSSAAVLVRGETGTGKELVAQAIHAASARKDKPFVILHCAALPDALLESELFGYERGAFTGATQRKPGRAELAEGGTLFFDEIGEITPALQVKLLRLLQEKEVTRLGGTASVRLDLRFIAATHRDLERAVADGTFREDLYYRLNVIPRDRAAPGPAPLRYHRPGAIVRGRLGPDRPRRVRPDGRAGLAGQRAAAPQLRGAADRAERQRRYRRR